MKLVSNMMIRAMEKKAAALIEDGGRELRKSASKIADASRDVLGRESTKEYALCGAVFAAGVAKQFICGHNQYQIQCDGRKANAHLKKAQELRRMGK